MLQGGRADHDWAYPTWAEMIYLMQKFDNILSGKTRVYGKFCIETLHERHNGIQRLVVCLSEYLEEWSGPLVSNIT